jgi:pimeloyl-ACP methyl ester carboxylesterase
MVGDVGGGSDSPARGLYPRLAEELPSLGIAALRVQYRCATELAGAVLDTLAGIRFLKSLRMQTFGVVGHSFGGAVAIQAAANEPAVRCVAVLGTQGHGTDPLPNLAETTAVFFVHGGRDEVLPSSGSINAYALAYDPKRIVIHPGAGHCLDEAADAVYRDIREWVLDCMA